MHDSFWVTYDKASSTQVSGYLVHSSVFFYPLLIDRGAVFRANHLAESAKEEVVIGWAFELRQTRTSDLVDDESDKLHIDKDKEDGDYDVGGL